MSEDKDDDTDINQQKIHPTFGKLVIVTIVALTLSIATIGASIMQANAAVTAAKDSLVKIPPRICTTTLTISSPANGANFFENERGPGNDGFMTIKFSGSLSNPCRVVFANLNWYLDGKSLGAGGVVYKTLFAGCESYTPHTATLVATFQSPPAKAQSDATFQVASSMSKSVSFTTGAVC
ncbi:hypothetical protein [Nitrososphaera viennensis]|uniref:Uncharacterized protein n=2 Tax=Nitrososphaera viennensis TaxID=1034015 RepID=A0A060HU05_9ARCH|nr:hypothetical protein [Nitrososphaera viennensis]AIC16587.1 hypothetical protein NVIE_023290 [Nitrososphaera viennensis EN76]UVS68517.1 hypothetical protein NWT39_11470 [Nitrososphaera viennensis]